MYTFIYIHINLYMNVYTYIKAIEMHCNSMGNILQFIYILNSV